MRRIAYLGACMLMFSLLMPAACSTIPKMKITCGLGPELDALKGKEIYFRFIDDRPEKDIIGKGAEDIYKGFSGNMNLFLSRGEEKYLEGVYYVDGLFAKVFTAYFKNKGLSLVEEPGPGIPELNIRLKEFVLGLKDRTWTFKVEYEARFTHKGDKLIKRFEQQGEKTRITGTGQADQLISETLTDVVNRLDIKETLSNAAKE